MLGARLTVTRFSTEGFAAHERHDAWRSRFWPSMASASESRPLVPFGTFTEEVHLGSTAIIYSTFTAQHIRRTPQMARADGIDHIGVCIGLNGTINGDGYMGRPGSMILSDLARGFEHEAADMRFITFSLPRKQLIERGIDADLLQHQTFSATQTAMLRSHLLQLRRSAPQLSAAAAPMLSNTILDLFAVTLCDAGRPVDPSPGMRDTAIKHRALDLIDEQIGRASLNVSSLGRQLQVSRSTLYRLFEEEGGVQAFIRNRRLDLVRAALLDPIAREPIRDIAERLGFGDPAYLSRVFRQEFGLSPSDFRMIETGFSR